MLRLFFFLIIALYSANTTQGGEGLSEKPKAAMGGQLYFSSISDEIVGDETTTDINFKYSFGTFTSPGFVLGATVLFGHRSRAESSLNVLGIGPRICSYGKCPLLKPKSKIGAIPYLTADLLFLYATWNNGGNAEGFSAGAGTGFVFANGSHYALDLGISYNLVGISTETDKSMKGTVIQGNLGILILLD